MIHCTGPRLVGVKPSRNRGHQNAVVAGLFSAEDDVQTSLHGGDIVGAVGGARY